MQIGQELTELCLKQKTKNMGLNSLRALGMPKSRFKGFQAIFKQMDLFLMQDIHTCPHLLTPSPYTYNMLEHRGLAYPCKQFVL
jgi:hypothetical protein